MISRFRVKTQPSRLLGAGTKVANSRRRLKTAESERALQTVVNLLTCQAVEAAKLADICGACGKGGREASWKQYYPAMQESPSCPHCKKEICERCAGSGHAEDCKRKSR